jgi:hypothetical protein
VPIRYDEVERATLSKLELDIALILDDDSAQRARDLLDAENAKLTVVKKAIRNLLFLAEKADDMEEMQQRLTELRAEELTLKDLVRKHEDRLAVPELGETFFERFQKLGEALDRAEGDERFALRLRVGQDLKRIVDRIEFYPDGDEAWSEGMRILGIRPGRDHRFWAVIFKTGKGTIMAYDGSKRIIWPGPKTPDGVREAAEWPLIERDRLGKMVTRAE